MDAPGRILTPDWRWAEVEAYVKADSAPGRAADPAIRRGHRFLRRWRTATTELERIALGRDLPHTSAAFILHGAFESERWLIEGGLLTPVSIEELADYAGVEPGVVIEYETLFFNVRPRLKHRGWVLNQILMPHLACARGLDQASPDFVYKLIGYSLGWDALKDWIDDGADDAGVADRLSAVFRKRVIKLGYAASHRIELNNFNSVEVMQLAAELLRDRDKQDANKSIDGDDVKLLASLTERFNLQGLLPPGKRPAASKPVESVRSEGPR